MREERVLLVVVRCFLAIALIAALLWLAWTVRTVLVLFLAAAVLATGISPIVDAIAGNRPERKVFRLPRAIGVLALYAGLLLGVALIMIGIVPPLVRESEDFVRGVPGYVEAAREGTRTLAASYPMLAGLEDWLAGQAEGGVGSLGDLTAQTSRVLQFALDVVNGVVAFFLLLVLTFYLVIDGATLRQGVLALLPPARRPLAMVVGERVRQKIAGWLIGQLLLSTIIGLTTFAGLIALRVPYALLLAVIAAFGELVPMLGPVLAGVPAVIVAAFVSPVLGLATLALYVVIQQLENHLIVPQVMRRAVDLPPVIVILALLMGSEVLGVVGAILALPLAAAASVVVSELVALRHDGGYSEEE